MQVVDFTNLPKRNKLYAGANGSKISVIYEGQQYMLKFPPILSGRDTAQKEKPPEDARVPSDVKK